MSRLTIRCHPYAPVSAEELESWLREQIDALRSDVPDASIQLLRLTRGLPSGDCTAGWLLELELPDSAAPQDLIAEFLRDMRLLGLQTRLLVPSEQGAAGAGARLREARTRLPATAARS
jgi:hypothetical protein